jgi:hypothetical protein
MMKNPKLYLYFVLALLPALMVEKMPETGWDWFKWGGLALYQGLLAVKAFTSNPETPE